MSHLHATACPTHYPSGMWEVQYTHIGGTSGCRSSTLVRKALAFGHIFEMLTSLTEIYMVLVWKCARNLLIFLSEVIFV
jgi:hypothetical protein